MAVAIRTITRLQDADDAPSLGAGQNGYALTWDNASGAFVATALFTGGLLATGATTGATSQAQLFSSGITTRGLYDAGLDVVVGSSFANNTDKQMLVYLQSGASAEQRSYFAWRNYSSVIKWMMGKDIYDAFILYDSAGAAHRMYLTANGATDIDAAGTGAVVINGHGDAGSGTGGLIVKSGGETPAVIGSLATGLMTFNGNALFQATADDDAYVNCQPYSNAGITGFIMSSSGGTLWSGMTTNAGTGEVKVGGFSAAYFLSVYSGSAEVIRLTTTGLVGIGKTVPAAKLHIDQAASDGAIPVLLLDQGDDDQPMIELTGTVGAGNVIEAVGIKTLTTTHFLKCTISGVGTVYLPLGTIA